MTRLTQLIVAVGTFILPLAHNFKGENGRDGRKPGSYEERHITEFFGYDADTT